MITNVPTPDDFRSNGLAFLNLAWDSVLSISANFKDSEEQRYHLSRLFKRGTALADQRRHEIDVAPVEDLRNDKGRLDAELISKMFDLNMTELASSVGITRQALSKTPDSLSIQPALRDFERIARSLLLVIGSGKGLRMWLNSPNEKFDDHTPLEIHKLGKVRLLADWIDDARLGSPD